ncbi:MAG: hypothetical protein AAGC60_29520 [Acidobacteriota bacterium]
MHSDSTMPPPPPASPPPASVRPTATRADRLLIGCGLGCGCLVLLGAVLLGLAGVWIFTPGKQVSTLAVATPEAPSVVRLDDLGSDAGTLEMLDALAVALSTAQNQNRRDQLPEEWGWLADLDSSQGSGRGLAMFLPREATLRVEAPGPAGESRWVAALNPRAFARPLRMVFESAAESAGAETGMTLGGRPALETGDGMLLVFVDGTIVVGSEATLVEDAIARLERGVTSPLEARPPAGPWDLIGRLQGHQALAFVPALDAPTDSALADDPALRLDLGIDIAGADRVLFGAHLACTAACCSDSTECPFAEALRAGYADLAQRLADDTGMTLRVEITPEADHLLLEAELEGVAAALADTLETP